MSPEPGADPGLEALPNNKGEEQLEEHRINRSGRSPLYVQEKQDEQRGEENSRDIGYRGGGDGSGNIPAGDGDHGHGGLDGRRQECQVEETEGKSWTHNRRNEVAQGETEERENQVGA